MGATNESSGSAIYKLKLANLGAEPYITRMEKKDGEWVEAERFNTYQGKLEGVEFDEYEYTQGRKTHKQQTMVLHFSDNGNPEKLEMNLNFIAKNVINILANESNVAGADIKIRVWSGSDFGGIQVHINGEKGAWKFEPDAVKKVNALADADARWIAMAEEHIISQFKGYERTAPSAVTEQEALSAPLPKNITEEKMVGSADELPF